MFFRCTQGHEEVRWSRTAGDCCWFCRQQGEPYNAMVITSRLPSEMQPRWWNRSVTA